MSQSDKMPQQAGKTFIKGYQTAATLTAFLVFLQAALAGRFLFVDADAVNLHEMVGSAISGVVFAQVALAFLAPLSNKGLVRVTTGLLATLVVAQTGLGYIGRDEANAAAVHVPLGVLIFGLSSVLATLSFTVPTTTSGNHGQE